jgi:hypothetical protein
MSAPRPPLETVRAWVEGTLSPRDREAFAAALAADRGLADLVAEYADVHAATVHEAPACPVTAGTLRLDAPPVRTPVLTWVRRATPIAAALLVVAGAAFAISRMTPSEPSLVPEGGPLVLRAIRAEGREPPPAPPAILAHYTPATDERIAFLSDYAEAKAVARAASRPLLVFLSLEECPICRGMRAQAFRDESVVRAAQGFVLAAVSPGDLDPGDPLLRALTGNRWPAFAAFDTSGALRREHGFPLTGVPPDANAVADELKAAYAALPASDRSRPPSWDDLHAAARALRDADDEEDPAARRAAWLSVLKRRVEGPLADRARALLAQDSKAAREALEAARGIAAKEGAAAARARIDADLPRFAGTPYADDLRRVRDRLERDGAFPPVVLAR